MTIDSPSNPVVRSLRALASAKGRGESALFLVEGVRGIEDGLASGARPTTVLYNADLLARTERGTALAERFRAMPTTGIYEASERALGAAAQTEHPQGALAAFPIPLWPDTPILTATPLVVICDNVSDPGNMGTLLRSAEAAGTSMLLAARGCVDLFNPKVVRAAVGAHFRLPAFQNFNWEDVEARLAANGIPSGSIYCTAADAPTAYDAADWRAASGLIVSSEAHGISAEAARLCSKGGGMVKIPMSGGTESLNAAVAASIILFEAARQRRQDQQSRSSSRGDGSGTGA